MPGDVGAQSERPVRLAVGAQAFYVREGEEEGEAFDGEVGQVAHGMLFVWVLRRGRPSLCNGECFGWRAHDVDSRRWFLIVAVESSLPSSALVSFVGVVVIVFLFLSPNYRRLLIAMGTHVWPKVCACVVWRAEGVKPLYMIEYISLRIFFHFNELLGSVVGGYCVQVHAYFLFCAFIRCSVNDCGWYIVDKGGPCFHEVVYPFMRARFVFEVIRCMFVGEFMHVPGGERGVGIVIYYVAYALYA